MITPDRKIIASVSGGKDSTAMCLHLQELGLDYTAVHMDTGWEHPSTDEYLREVLPRHIGPIEWVTPEYQMRDLILKKGMFPSQVIRFCTQWLKIFPFIEWVETNCTEPPINAVGLRAEESAKRAKMDEYQEECWVLSWRPLLKWTIDEVVAIHKRHGVPTHPLYTKGFTRVGCWPCIFARKKEISMLADMDPGRIDEIRDMEAILGAKERAPGKRDPTYFARRTVKNKVRTTTPHRIDDVVAWARTSRGGRQRELFYEPDRSGCLRWGFCDF